MKAQPAPLIQLPTLPEKPTSLRSFFLTRYETRFIPSEDYCALTPSCFQGLPHSRTDYGARNWTVSRHDGEGGTQCYVDGHRTRPTEVSKNANGYGRGVEIPVGMVLMNDQAFRGSLREWDRSGLDEQSGHKEWIWGKSTWGLGPKGINKRLLPSRSSNNKRLSPWATVWHEIGMSWWYNVTWNDVTRGTWYTNIHFQLCFNDTRGKSSKPR